MRVLDYLALVSPYYWVGAGIFLVLATMLLFCMAVGRRVQLLMEQDNAEPPTQSQHGEQYQSSQQETQSEESPQQHSPGRHNPETESGFRQLPNESSLAQCDHGTGYEQFCPVHGNRQLHQPPDDNDNDWAR